MASKRNAFKQFREYEIEAEKVNYTQTPGRTEEQIDVYNKRVHGHKAYVVPALNKMNDIVIWEWFVRALAFAVFFLVFSFFFFRRGVGWGAV